MNSKRISVVVCGLVLVAFLLTACAPVAATPVKVVSGNPTYEESITPSDGSVIGDPRPAISWTVYPNGHTIEYFRLLLDGREVSAVRAARGSGVGFSYKPQADLAPGSHSVTASIAFEGYQPLTLVSRFTIAGNQVNPFEGLDINQLDKMQEEALNHLNVIRGRLGLATLSINRSLTAAAQAHSNFLQLNNLIGHYQNKNYSGFTGVTPQERAVFFGYGGLTTEGIDYGTASPRMSVEGLLDAPYHRLGLINPNDREAGVGFSLKQYNMVINTGVPGSRDDARVMIYPYPGQTAVKTTWFAAESPNPLATYNQDRVYVGYPISLSIHDSNTRELRLSAASLKDSAGSEVACYIVDSSRETESKKHVFLIPRRPLKPGVTYQAKIAGQRITADGGSASITAEWSFTTKEQLELDYLGLVKLEGVENLEIKLKSGDTSDLSYLLIKNGEFVRKYHAIQGFSWMDAAPLMPGRYRLQLSAPSVSADLTEYIVDIREAAGQKQAVVISQSSLGRRPSLLAGILRLGAREYIELYWPAGKPSGVSYQLLKAGAVVRSYSNDRYYAPQDRSLADGDYMLQVTQAGTKPEEYVLSLYTENNERRISLTPVK